MHLSINLKGFNELSTIRLPLRLMKTGLKETVITNDETYNNTLEKKISLQICIPVMRDCKSFYKQYYLQSYIFRPSERGLTHGKGHHFLPFTQLTVCYGLVLFDFRNTVNACLWA